MSDFDTKRLPTEPTAIAPDGSEVRALLSVARGGMAHFQLKAGQTSAAVEHRTVEEIWYILSGTGEMWRSQADREETIDLSPGVCLTLPAGTRFQFRALGSEPLAAVAVTMPPWPGDAEAMAVAGPWR
jgi:mannose-6-phosphate isomerase-like protein (cupin superfamily)